MKKVRILSLVMTMILSMCQPMTVLAENVEETVDELRMNPLIPKDVPVHGLIFHPRTGEIEVIVNGYTQMKQYYEK